MKDFTLDVKWPNLRNVRSQEDDDLHALVEQVIQKIKLLRSPAQGPDVFVPTKFQRAILKALDGRALTKDKLAAEVCEGASSRLYRRGGLTELMERGLVDNKKNGGGYFRPDRPPRDW